MDKFFIKKPVVSNIIVDTAVAAAPPAAAAAAAVTLKPSAEQAAIIELFRKGANITADCVAGSGKTTTVILLACAFPEKKFIQITYNSQLKLEVRTKINDLGIKNLEIHTYHSLWVRYYNAHGFTDDVIRRGIDADCKPVGTLPQYDAAIIDEAQDMTLLYYCLIHKFIKDTKGISQLMTLGDCFQSIYKFKGSDHRFLTLSNEIWKRLFTSATLSTSYRITNQIAQFVNEIMIGGDRIKAVKDGPKVSYIVSNSFSSHHFIADLIQKKLNVDKLNPDDIFVLCPSLTMTGYAPPSRRLENELVKRGVPCYYPTSDERKLDEEIIKGKIVFSTFHQSKGRERKYVIIYGFDESYFLFYGKDLNPCVCPETLYVAVTRAKEELVLIHDCRFKTLSFIKPTLFEMSFEPYSSYMKIYRLKEMQPSSPSNEVQHVVNVTDLTKFIKEDNIKLLTDIANTVFYTISEPSYDLDIPCKLKLSRRCDSSTGTGTSTGTDSCGDSSSSTDDEDDLYEDVSDINGIVIPAIYEAESQGSESTIEKEVHQLYDNLCRQQNKHHFIQKVYNKLNHYGSQSVDDYIRMAIMYISLKEEIYHKIAQISRHNWLDRSLITPCFSVLSTLIDTESALYERGIYVKSAFNDFGVVELLGRLDVFDKRHVLEIKCTQTLTLEHKMQLLVYAWMWKKQTDSFYDAKEFKLVNIRTGEILSLDTTSHLLDEAIHILLENKYGKRSVLSDSEFIESCTLAISRRAHPTTMPVARSHARALERIGLPAPCKSSKKCLIVDDDDTDPVNVCSNVM
jgi:hypothetical protein